MHIRQLMKNSYLLTVDLYTVYATKKPEVMKKYTFSLLLITGICFLVACKKEDTTSSERFNLLTAPLWTSDSLLANGEDASGPGELLEKFTGDAKFNEDGTGYFGQYTGNWTLTNNDEYITIASDSLTIPVTCYIEELTESDFKIVTSFPVQEEPLPVDIRITFKPK